MAKPMEAESMERLTVSLPVADWFLILRALESKALGVWEAPERGRDDVLRVAREVREQVVP